jgi:hypothetical protein
VVSAANDGGMGREYKRWLIAKGNVFNPSGAAIAKLVAKLVKDQWIAEPATSGAGTKVPSPLEAAWIDNPNRSDLVLRWTALRSPLAEGKVAELQIHRGEDFIYPDYEPIGALESDCACGEDLAFTWDEDELPSPFGSATGIFTECSECSRTFDPAKFEATVTDVRTGQKTKVRGGAAHRFAIVVAGPLADGAVPSAFDADFIALCEAEFGRNFYEIGAVG